MSTLEINLEKPDSATDDPQSEIQAINAEYLSITDLVNREVLPGNANLGDITFPLKGDVRTRSTFIKRNSGFVTTGLKLIKQINDNQTVTQEDIEKLFIVLTAHQSMLQSEQSAVVVEGTGVGKEATQMFRFLTKNSFFSSHETQAIENAIRITTAASAAQPQNNSGNNSNQNGYRGNNRGGYRGNNRGYGRGFNRGYQNNGGNNHFRNNDSFERNVSQHSNNP